MKKYLLLTFLFLSMCMEIYAQTINEWISEAKSAPKPTEELFIGLTGVEKGGWYWIARPGIWFDFGDGHRKTQGNDLKSDEEIEKDMYYYIINSEQYKDCQRKNPNSIIRMRNLEYEIKRDEKSDETYKVSIVKTLVYHVQLYIEKPLKPLSVAINRALENIREGSRLAIDQIKVTEGENKEDYKDQIVELLLDKGYKVVAKEYLDKLYDEQQAQQSGIYNDRTTVKENNISAVGFYINVRQTQTSINVQVINVSTGEYEGNYFKSVHQDKYTKNLSSAIDKALRYLNGGSRVAIDQVSVINGINKEDYKDLVINVLLDKGYRVIAKEQFEKLYEEQKTQQNGKYNERTTVQENNFSAVGYYINVKATENSLRIQVVNVSTGEYEGNATINI